MHTARYEKHPANRWTDRLNRLACESWRQRGWRSVVPIRKNDMLKDAIDTAREILVIGLFVAIATMSMSLIWFVMLVMP